MRFNLLRLLSVLMLSGCPNSQSTQVAEVDNPIGSVDANRSPIAADLPLVSDVFSELKEPNLELRTGPWACREKITLSSEMQRIVDIKAGFEILSKRVAKLMRLELLLRYDLKTAITAPTYLISPILANEEKLDKYGSLRNTIVAKALEESERQHMSLVAKYAELQIELEHLAMATGANPYLSMLHNKERESDNSVVREYTAKWRIRFKDALAAVIPLQCVSVPESSSTDEINILLIGKSGAGMSTMINIIYNHLNGRAFVHRDIIVPLKKKNREINVTVESFKLLRIQLRKSGSQTDRVQKYSFVIDGTTINLFDAPGFRNSVSLVSDDTIAEMISLGLKGKSINAILLLMQDNEFVRHLDGYFGGVTHAKLVLPRVFSDNVIGVYNRLQVSKTSRNGYEQEFATFFPTSQVLAANRIFFIDGTSFFAIRRIDSKFYDERIRNWNEDGQEVNRMFDVIRK